MDTSGGIYSLAVYGQSGRIYSLAVYGHEWSHLQPSGVWSRVVAFTA